jgi:hypothetical protein
MTSTASTVRHGATVLLAAAGLLGYLGLSGALDPVLRDAVQHVRGATDPAADSDSSDGSGPDGSDGSGPDSADSPGPGSADNSESAAFTVRMVRVADWQTNDPRPEWGRQRLVPGGPKRSSIGRPASPSRPQVAPPENPKRRFWAEPAPMPRHTLAPMRSCPQQRGPGVDVEHLTVTAGVKSATVTWWDLGDPDTTGYAIGAVVMGEAGGVSWTPVAAPGTCREVTATVRGLKSGTRYQFWLVATNRSNAQDRTYRPSRGQSETVMIG